MSYFKKLFEALETPREKRPLGSGWRSGALSVLIGLISIALMIIMRFPAVFSTPEIQPILEGVPMRIVFQVFLVLGYGFAIVSLLLSTKYILPVTGLTLVIIAALFSGPAYDIAINSEGQSIYFGLDFFVMKVLTVGILFLPLERLFPNDPNQTVLRYAWREDFFYFAVSSLLVQVFNYLTLAPTEIVNNNFNFDDIRYYLFDLPLVVQVILIMLATDFIQYWVHYAFHKIPFLWRFHSIHHSVESLDWIAGARMHFLEIIILRSATALPMLTLGFDPVAVQVYLIIVYFYSAFVHANLGINFKFVERWLVTPRFHHWHHGSEREAIDINFAIHFPLLDWLFGTYHMPEKRWPESYGVNGEDIPKGYFKQLIHPFKKKVKAARKDPKT